MKQNIRAAIRRYQPDTYKPFRKFLKKHGLLDRYEHLVTEYVLVSLGKAGSTWLRLMVSRALQQHFQLGDINLMNRTALMARHPDVPKIRQVASKTVSDFTQFRDKKIILLARDPRDSIVAAYFQRSKRVQSHEKYEGELSQYIRDAEWNFENLVRIYNLWANHAADFRDICFVRYEDLRRSTESELAKVLKFLGVQAEAAVVRDAVEFAKFDNMRKMEQENRFGKHALSSANKDDPESFKTRKGKVGGYVEYLNDEDITFVNDTLRNLSSFYGYDGAACSAQS